MQQRCEGWTRRRAAAWRPSIASAPGPWAVGWWWVLRHPLPAALSRLGRQRKEHALDYKTAAYCHLPHRRPELIEQRRWELEQWLWRLTESPEVCGWEVWHLTK